MYNTLSNVFFLWNHVPVLYYLPQTLCKDLLTAWTVFFTKSSLFPARSVCRFPYPVAVTCKINALMEFLTICLQTFYGMHRLIARFHFGQRGVWKKSSLSRTNVRSAGNFAHAHRATMRNLWPCRFLAHIVTTCSCYGRSCVSVWFSVRQTRILHWD